MRHIDNNNDYGLFACKQITATVKPSVVFSTNMSSFFRPFMFLLSDMQLEPVATVGSVALCTVTSVAGVSMDSMLTEFYFGSVLTGLTTVQRNLNPGVKL